MSLRTQQAIKMARALDAALKLNEPYYEAHVEVCGDKQDAKTRSITSAAMNAARLHIDPATYIRLAFETAHKLQCTRKTAPLMIGRKSTFDKISKTLRENYAGDLSSAVGRCVRGASELERDMESLRRSLRNVSRLLSASQDDADVVIAALCGLRGTMHPGLLYSIPQVARDWHRIEDMAVSAPHASDMAKIVRKTVKKMGKDAEAVWDELMRRVKAERVA